MSLTGSAKLHNWNPLGGWVPVEQAGSGVVVRLATSWRVLRSPQVAENREIEYKEAACDVC